jgi:hypothetical protein
MAYTREQIGQALKAAHEAGDVEAARTLAVAYRDWKPSTPDPAMNRASERANMAFRANEKIAPADLTQLGRPDFSSAAMARLPAPTMSVADMDAFEAQRAAEKERLRVPDNDFKERSIIALNVPTFGFGPQAAAGAKTLGALAATPFIEDDIIDREGVSGAMSSFLDDARVHQRRAREERPLESFGTEIALGVLQGKTLIDNFGRKVFPKTNTASNLGRVVGTGTGYGLAYGFGQSESGTLQGALGDAAFGGALGAGFGLGFKAAEPALTAGYRSAKTGAATISDALSDLLGKAGGARDKVAQEVALAAVRRSMERSGMTFDQIMELVKRYEGKPAVLAEVIGQDAVNSLTALTRRPGSTPQKAQDLIEERFYGRPDRMKGDVEDTTGIPIGQLDDTLDAQLIERQQAAKPIYDALYKQYSTIKSFGESLKRINRLARTPAMQKHLKLAEEAVKTQAAIRQVPVSKMSKMEYWDLVKRSLDDEINSAVAKGEARTKVGASVAELTQLKSAITDEFDRLTGGAYAAAREAGGEAPRLRAAAAAGQKALQARNPRDVAKTVAATLSQDLPALRAGIVEDLGTRIDKGMTPGRVRVPDVAGKLRAGLGDESANKLINRLDAEATLSETGSRWAPRLNSVTGTVMESGATQMGDDLVNAGMNLATGNKVGLARQAINFMRQRGFSQRQIDAIGDLLLSSPEEGLRRLRMLAPDGAPTNALAPATGAADGALNSTAQGGTPAANALAQPAPVRASGFTGLRTDAGNAAVGAGLGALGPADSNEERLRNMAIGAGIGIVGGSRTVGKALGVQGDDVARTAGAPRTPQQAVRFETPGSPEYEAAVAKGLDMSQAGRMARARKQGFNTNRVLYHGTNRDFESFDVSKSLDGLGVHMGTIDQAETLIDNSIPGLSNKRQIFYEGAKVLPLYVRANKSIRLPDMENWEPHKVARVLRRKGIKVKASGLNGNVLPSDIVKALKDKGYDSIVYKNRFEGRDAVKGKGADSLIVFDPSNIRSVNAAFDPDKAASPILTAGAGGGRKPPTGKPGKLGTRTADAAAIATLGLQGGTADADTGGLSAELKTANERVALAEKTVADTRSGITKLQSQLEMLQDPAGDIAAKQSILKLRGRKLGTTGPRGDGVDGVDGPNTIAAINDEAAKIEAAIAREQASLEKAQIAETKALDAAKQVRMQKIQADAQPGKGTELAREFGPYGGVAAGIAAAYLMRRGAGQKFAKASQTAADNANALLTGAPISLRAGVQHPNSINVRATKLNDFARQGGAPSGTTPFDDKQTGSFRPRAKKNTVDPSDLYPKPGFMASRLRIPDYGWSATGLIEAQVAGGFRAKEEKKIAEYEADVERFAAAGDEAGLQRASANLQQAENMYAIALAFERAGYAYAGTRMLAGLKDPYKFVRPDIKGYEEEASSLRTAISKK